MKLDRTELEEQFIQLMSEYKTGNKNFDELGEKLINTFQIDHEYFSWEANEETSEDDDSDEIEYGKIINTIEKSLERKLTKNERSMVYILSTAVTFYDDNEEEEEE